MRWWQGLRDVDDERMMGRLRRLVTFVLVAGLVACAGESGSAPDDPSLLAPNETQGPVDGPTATTLDLDGRDDAIAPPPADAVPVSAVVTSTGRSPLPGFGEVLVEVVAADGTVLTSCLLLAETPAQTQRGLMEVLDPDLGGYDGMLFRFDVDNAGGFYMRNTPQELSIAYLDAAGGLVSTTVMAPCEDVEGCPTYAAEAPFRYALEVPVGAGGVEAIGVVPGAIVRDLRTTCPAA
jgi:uncharacterized membrane protein (UPF0127 family)